mgnify:CR=1 FL=1
MSNHKVLIVAQNDEQKIAFGDFDVVEVAPDTIFKFTTMESFSDGKKFDKFDYVIMYFPQFESYDNYNGYGFLSDSS